ncbi:MAG: fibrillarin-like rRNA/tRNA 2'-O-methyltransferase [Candidatus Bathyarchaeota archaeon]|jgi:fibrillarin-like pre-rRNA processing protein
MRQIFPGVYVIERDSGDVVATKNLTPGVRFYGEEILEVEGIEYRAWNPFRSKLSAAILKGLKKLMISPRDKILYLGVASGTTCSHISDIVEMKGHIWGVDFAPRPMRDLIQNLARIRGNISPILGDARQPGSYIPMVPKVERIYADVAQPDQAEIVTKNARLFLKGDGWIMMAIKSQSIDVRKTPREVYAREILKLREGGFEIYETLLLDPYEKDHAFVVARYRN